VATSRRNFLTAFRKPLENVNPNKENLPLVVRPPYGLNESLFQSECIECDLKECVTSCDEKIIIIMKDGTPKLNFSKSGCTFCEECAIACHASDEDVLSLENNHTSEQINAIFKISTDACVAHHGVICFSCKEPCIDDAILFNGMFSPVIDMSKCTACGFCLGRCPTDAIEYKAIEINQIEEIS
jgi:ferredoxin-type protein NapF